MKKKNQGSSRQGKQQEAEEERQTEGEIKRGRGEIAFFSEGVQGGKKMRANSQIFCRRRRILAPTPGKILYPPMRERDRKEKKKEKREIQFVARMYTAQCACMYSYGSV